MIEEVGSVVEVKGKHVAVVLCEKSSFCQNCASMESCQLGNDNRSKLVEAHNSIGASVGDTVKLAVSDRHFLQSSFLLYIVPLLALLFGAISGHFIGLSIAGAPDPNVLSAILGTAFLVGSFFVIKIGCRAIPKETFMPRIVRVVQEDDVFANRLKHEELKHGH